MGVFVDDDDKVYLICEDVSYSRNTHIRPQTDVLPEAERDPYLRTLGRLPVRCQTGASIP
jgi:hypothetical protein